MTPAPDHIAELALLEMSRLQRETLTRWVPILVHAGEYKLAKELAEVVEEADPSPLLAGIGG